MNEIDMSIIVPCYREEEAISIFYSEIAKVLQGMNIAYEILFIDDGSDDRTLEIMKQIASRNNSIQYYSLSRNFGKESAIFAGLCNAKGKYVAVMDVDLQDPPNLLPRMLEIIQNQDYDSVATKRDTRTGEPILRSFLSNCFYKIINKVSDIEITHGARDFRLMKRNVVDAILSMGEYNRFIKGIYSWVGFNTYWISYDNVERSAGKTKWSFRQLIKYALDGVLDFSQVPLKIASWCGLSITLLAILMMIYIIAKKLIVGNPVTGWASIAVIIFFVGGIQLFCVGIIGQYIARIFLETKKRPHFIIAESNNQEYVAIN